MGRFLLKADLTEADDRLRALRAGLAPDRPPPTDALRRAVEASTGLAVAAIEGQARRGTFRWVVPAELGNGLRVMIRVNRLDHVELETGLAVEARLLRYLRTIGLAVPAVVAVDTSKAAVPAAFGVVERLEGPTLADCDDDDVATERALRLLGRYLRELHGVCLAGAGPIAIVAERGGPTDFVGIETSWADYVVERLPDHLAALVTGGVVAAETAGAIERRIRAGRYDDISDRLLHGDPGGPNVILAMDGTVKGLVDWEDALVGAPIFEIASCAAFHPERRWPALFEGYRFALAQERGCRFWLYYLRIAVARTVVRLRFGIGDPPGRPAAAGRITRAMEALGLPEAVRP